MAKGAYYPIYMKVNLYSNAAQAQAYGSNYSSTISPNTGSDSGSYNAISSVEGKGNCYVDTSVGMTAYYPAFPIWWVPYWGGSGYLIGWTNDSKNASASVPTLSTSSTNIGNSVTINFNRQSSSFTHTIWWRLSGGSWNTLVTKTTAASYAWNTNNNKSTLLRALPTSTSGNFQIRVSTYNGSTLVGTKYKDLTLKVPTSVKPTIGTLTVTETNSAVSALKLGYFVVGVSTFKTTISNHVVAGEGANFKNVQFKLGGWGWVTTSSASTTFGASGQGKPEVTAIITDSRGRSDSKTITISQTPYSVPSITGFSASRYNQENKTQVQVVLKATQTKLSNKNTMRYKLEYKKATETSWKQLKAYSAYQSGDFNITTVQTIANDSKYNIRVSVQDLIGNVITSIFTVTSTSKKWLEVTNGETINVIGRLHVNGSIWDTSNGIRNLSDTVSELADKKILSADGTMKAIQGEYVDLCELTFPRDGKYYLVVGATNVSISDTSNIMNCDVWVKNTALYAGNSSNKTIMTAGGGCTTVRLIKTRTDSTTTVTLKGYGYSTSTYDYSGELFAVRI